MRICVAAFATVLLAASLSSQFADAGGQTAKTKEHKAIDQSYATLADHLRKTTKSKELADNIKAAGSFLNEHPDSKQDVIELANAFASLKSDPLDLESLCSKDNLANLRRVAEGIRDGGNLGPYEITLAISRLNKIVIDVIADTLEACDPYLAGKWPKPWQPNFSDPAMKQLIDRLYLVSKLFSYDGFFLGPESLGDNRFKFMSFIIEKGAEAATEPIDPDEPAPLKTKNTTVIAMQLDEYVYKPCLEFVSLDESKEVLVPFNDLLKSWYVVSSGLIENYLDHFRGRRRVQLSKEAAEVRYLAFEHQACQRFFATPKEELAVTISKERARGYQSG